MTVEWLAAGWPAPPNVHAGTTLRGAGVSAGAYTTLNLGEHVADDPARVAENRRRFANACALPSEPVWLCQTHSSNVALDAPDCPDPGTDAIVTRKAGRVCAVLTADCLPVVFAASSGDEVAIAHAGWRGLCVGILEATVAAMRTPAADILVWLGPAIAQPAFEVGVEVRQQFVEQDDKAAAYFLENKRGRYQADLSGLARQRLQSLGVSEVHGGEHCTHAESSRFFSFRRDGQCGRMATFVYFAG